MNEDVNFSKENNSRSFAEWRWVFANYNVVYQLKRI